MFDLKDLNILTIVDVRLGWLDEELLLIESFKREDIKGKCGFDWIWLFGIGLDIWLIFGVLENEDADEVFVEFGSNDN